jgi:small subunit ribosomal protein S18
MITSRRPVKPISTDKNMEFSYTQPEVLSKFVTEQGAILPRTRTGLSQKQQRRLARAIKQARHLAMLPFTQTL